MTPALRREATGATATRDLLTRPAAREPRTTQCRRQSAANPGHKWNRRGCNRGRTSPRPRGHRQLSNWNPGCLRAVHVLNLYTPSQILTQILVDTGKGRHHRRCSRPGGKTEWKQRPNPGLDGPGCHPASPPSRAQGLHHDELGSGRWPPSTTF